MKSKNFQRIALFSVLFFLAGSFSKAQTLSPIWHNTANPIIICEDGVTNMCYPTPVSWDWDCYEACLAPGDVFNDITEINCEGVSQNAYSLMADGKPLMILWDGWDCGNCMAEAPSVSAFILANKDKMHFWMAFGGIGGGALCGDAADQHTIANWVSKYPAYANAHRFLDNDYTHCGGIHSLPHYTLVHPITKKVVFVSHQNEAGNNPWARMEPQANTLLASLATADTQAPSVPTNLSAGNIKSTSVVLTWTASTDNVGVSNYEVYRGATLVGSPTTNTFTVQGLTASTPYSFQVLAKDAATNASAKCTAINITTAASSSDVTPPTAPSNLSTTALGATSFTLNWTASTDAVGVVGYDVYKAGTLVGSTTTATSLAVTGLVASTTYAMTVKARDDAGNNSTAGALSVTTTAAPPVSGTIASWDLIGVNTAGGVNTAPVTTKNADLTVSNLVVGTGMGAPNNFFKDYLGGGDMANAMTLATAISSNCYLEFTLTPTAGKVVSITSLDLCAMTQGKAGTVSLLSNVAGFTAANLISSITTGAANETNINLQNLPVAGHDNLLSTTTFRIYFNSTLDWGFNYMAVGIGNRHAANTTAALIVNGTVSIPTSLIDVKTPQLTLYPNPATDKLSLKFSTPVEKAEISIVDVQGRILYQEPIRDVQTKEIEISQLMGGIYFLKMENKGIITNSKFVKQ